jgi:dTMP kinase
VEIAVDGLRPDLTLFLHVPAQVSEQRRSTRNAGSARQSGDRFEEADRAFFERVESGFAAIAAADPGRVKRIDATGSVEAVADAIWRWMEPRLSMGK